ncbi:hypothetical protein BHE74_00012939 [Ensete ventricosum]|nr:hypothetical protein BHE74_00012939 [Ensete ventricosum]
MAINTMNRADEAYLEEVRAEVRELRRAYARRWRRMSRELTIDTVTRYYDPAISVLEDDLDQDRKVGRGIPAAAAAAAGGGGSAPDSDDVHLCISCLPIREVPPLVRPQNVYSLLFLLSKPLPKLWSPC